VKWLPHNGHPRLRDGAGPLRMFTPHVDELRRWWSVESAGPHLLVVVDGVADGMGPWAAVPGVTVLRIGAPAGRRPTPSVVRLRLTEDGVERVVVEGEPPVPVGVPDELGSAQAAALARRLARYRPAGISADAAARAAPGLPGLLGLRPGPSGIHALRARWEAAAVDRLRVPIGVDERGAPVLLDLKESAQGGSGPHGLCIGATGSGKSELLRTLVVGLAGTRPRP